MTLMMTVGLHVLYKLIRGGVHITGVGRWFGLGGQQ